MNIGRYRDRHIDVCMYIYTNIHKSISLLNLLNVMHVTYSSILQEILQCMNIYKVRFIASLPLLYAFLCFYKIVLSRNIEQHLRECTEENNILLLRKFPLYRLVVIQNHSKRKRVLILRQY